MLTVDKYHSNGAVTESKRELAVGLLGYWRDTLADRLTLGENRIGSKQVSYELPSSILQTGRVDERLARRLLSVSRVTSRNKRGNVAPPIARQRDVLLAVGRLSPKTERAFRYGALRSATSLWIPAVLSDTGELKPQDNLHPFLAREILEPSSPEYPIIASLEDADAFYTEHIDGRGWTSQWSCAISWAFRLWECAVGEPFATFTHPLAELNRDTVVLYPAGENFIARKSMLALDYALKRLREGKPLPLLDTLVSGEPPEIRVNAQACRHSGHLASDPLGDDQRLALDYVLAMPEGSIQAVNGPPGAGKTTLLLDVLASQVTNAACSSEDAMAPRPPCIAVASTNNNAVTNVLDALNEIHDGTLFGSRWISGAPGYGVYFPADETKAESYDFFARDRSGPLRDVHEIAVEEHERVYLEAYEAAIGEKIAEIATVVESLHAKLLNEYKSLLRTIEARERYAACVPLNSEASIERERIERRHDEALAPLSIELDTAQNEFRRLEEFLNSSEAQCALASRALESSGWYEDWFSWLEGVRRRRIRRALDVLGEIGSGWDFPRSIVEMRARLERRRTEIITTLKQDRERLWQKRDRHDAAKREKARELNAFDAETSEWIRYAVSQAEHCDILLRDPRQADALFDRNERAQAFRLAMRYWEGRWILDLRQEKRSKEEIWDFQNRRSVLARLRRIAMIAPLAVMTLHELPKRYDFYDETPLPLFEQLDLLIIDEAGQVAVEIAVPAMLHAKRVVCVGDVYQLEPIVACGKALSRANYHRRVPDEQNLSWDDACVRGFASYQNGTGSAMRIAQQCTVFSSGDAAMFPGATLTQHFRCVPEIIRFSKELLYPYLAPRRASIVDALFPPMAYYHVRGISMNVHGSRVNEAEARLIADFLVHNYEKLRAAYPKARSLADIVGIVTPFTAQAECIAFCIDEAFKAASIDMSDTLPIGTVFSFQGGQQRIILYSHTYGPDDDPTYVDRKPNLLNVATTRAQDHFIVFADMVGLSARSPSYPSGRLARLLLEREENCLGDLPISYYQVPLRELEHFTTPEQHHALLDEALAKAQQRVVIVSPFLSGEPFADETLFLRFQEAVARGVKVIVFSDTYYNKRSDIGEELRGIGVWWYVISKIHAKTLAIDERALYEGSYNWLSASPNPRKRAHECGWLVRGAKATRAIVDVIAYYERRLSSRFPRGAEQQILDRSEARYSAALQI